MRFVLLCVQCMQGSCVQQWPCSEQLMTSSPCPWLASVAASGGCPGRRSVPTAEWYPGLCPSPVPPCPHRAPPLELVAAAVTARSALECADLERLETLGDAYLKFAVRRLLLWWLLL